MLLRIALERGNRLLAPANVSPLLFVRLLSLVVSLNLEFCVVVVVVKELLLVSIPGYVWGRELLG